MAIYQTSTSIQSKDSKEWNSYKVFENQQTVASSSEVNAKHAKAISLYTENTSASVSGGSVLLEGAPYSSYTGTWVTLGTITITSGLRVQSINTNDNKDGMPCAVVRARIATAITGGNINAYIITQG